MHCKETNKKYIPICKQALILEEKTNHNDSLHDVLDKG